MGIETLEEIGLLYVLFLSVLFFIVSSFLNGFGIMLLLEATRSSSSNLLSVSFT